MKTSDNELAAQAAKGDAVAFRALLERHYDSVYRIAYRFIANREDAEDIAQEVCAALAKKLRSFNGQAKFTTWLYRVVVNATRDMQRKHITAEKVTATYGELADLARGEQKQAQDDIDWLYEMLANVGADLRETAILVLAEGQSHAEAAEILDIKESTVSWRMHELKKKLKALAEQET